MSTKGPTALHVSPAANPPAVQTRPMLYRVVEDVDDIQVADLEVSANMVDGLDAERTGTPLDQLVLVAGDGLDAPLGALLDVLDNVEAVVGERRGDGGLAVECRDAAVVEGWLAVGAALGAVVGRLGVGAVGAGGRGLEAAGLGQWRGQRGGKPQREGCEAIGHVHLAGGGQYLTLKRPGDVGRTWRVKGAVSLELQVLMTRRYWWA